MPSPSQTTKDESNKVENADPAVIVSESSLQPVADDAATCIAEQSPQPEVVIVDEAAVLQLDPAKEEDAVPTADQSEPERFAFVSAESGDLTCHEVMDVSDGEAGSGQKRKFLEEPEKETEKEQPAAQEQEQEQGQASPTKRQRIEEEHQNACGKVKLSASETGSSIEVRQLTAEE